MPGLPTTRVCGCRLDPINPSHAAYRVIFEMIKNFDAVNVAIEAICVVPNAIKAQHLGPKGGEGEDMSQNRGSFQQTLHATFHNVSTSTSLLWAKNCWRRRETASLPSSASANFEGLSASRGRRPLVEKERHMAHQTLASFI